MPSAGGESSGIIDVRALLALAKQDRARAPTLRLAAPLLAAAGPAVAATRPASAAPGRPMLGHLYGALGTLLVGMVALAGHVFGRPIDVKAPEPPVSVVALAPAPDEPEPELPESLEVDREREIEPVSDESASADEPAAPAPRVRKTRKKPTAATAAEREKTRPAATGPDPTSVECLLAPETCRVPKKAQPAPADVPSPAVASSLPARLESADLIEGVRPAKASATAKCKRLARGGEIVKIRLSISGPAGTVIGAIPEDDAGNPALATCCADELTRASFRKVSRPQIGASVTVKF